METLSIIAVMGTGVLFYIIGLLVEIFGKATEEATIGNDKFLPLLQFLGSLCIMFSGMFFAASQQIVLGGFIGTLGAVLLVVSALKIIPFLRY